MSRALAPSPGDIRFAVRLTPWALLLGACLSLCAPALAAAAVPEDSPLRVSTLSKDGPPPSTAQVVTGALDGQFVPSASKALRQLSGSHWVRLQSTRSLGGPAIPVLTVESSRDLQVDLYSAGSTRAPTPLARAVAIPGFGGTREIAFIIPGAILHPGEVFYARLQAAAPEPDRLYFGAGTLADALARGSHHALMISLACGALGALALATAAMWLVLSDRLFILYAAMTGLQALYLAYFSGEGFRWPGLAVSNALEPYAWNVPVALSGTLAALFAREIADLRHTSPRVYRAFGWLALAFAVLAVANIGRAVGLGPIIAGVGNLMFLGAGVFVLVVAFSRGAGAIAQRAGFSSPGCCSKRLPS